MGTLRKMFGVFGKKETPKVTATQEQKVSEKPRRKQRKAAKNRPFYIKLSNNRKQTPGRLKRLKPYGSKAAGSPEFYPKRTKLKGYQKTA